MPLSPSSLFERRDERLAATLRQKLGRNGQIVSWHRQSDAQAHPFGPWMARISCPEVPETVEARGSTRCRAVIAAALKLDALIVKAR